MSYKSRNGCSDPWGCLVVSGITFVAVFMIALVIQDRVMKTDEQKQKELEQMAADEYKRKKVKYMHPDELRALITMAVEDGIRRSRQEEKNEPCKH